MKFEYLIEKILYELSNQGFSGTIDVVNDKLIELRLKYGGRFFGLFKFNEEQKKLNIVFRRHELLIEKVYDGDYDDVKINQTVINFCLQKIQNKKLVVHCKLKSYDVYIGRGRCPKTKRYSDWYNPYSHDPDSVAEHYVSTREEALEKYREYILNSPYLFSRLPELKNLVLGCWCKTPKNPNQSCHGDILVELIDQYW